MGVTTIDLLQTLSSTAAWIGPQQHAYFSVKGKIWAASTVGTSLQLRPPLEGASPENVLSNADNWVTQYRRGGIDWHGPAAQLEYFDLRPIFGPRSLSVPSPHGATVALTSIVPNNDETRFFLQAASGNVLELALSPEMELLSASVNGTEIAHLSDGKRRGKGAGNIARHWQPLQVTVETGDGPIVVQAYQKNCSLRTEDMNGIKVTVPEVAYAPVMRVIVMPSGEVWVGSAFCEVVALDETLVGFQVNRQTRDLQMFVGTQPRIPMDNKTRIKAFEDLLSRTDAQPVAELLEPEKTLKVASLFRDAPELANDPDMVVQSVKKENANVVVSLRRSWENIKVKVSPDLSVLSAERERLPEPIQPTGPALGKEWRGSSSFGR